MVGWRPKCERLLRSATPCAVSLSWLYYVWFVSKVVSLPIVMLERKQEGNLISHSCLYMLVSLNSVGVRVVLCSLRQQEPAVEIYFFFSLIVDNRFHLHSWR